jgi:hypothetical protein
VKITKIKTLGVALVVMLGTIAVTGTSVQAQDNVRAFTQVEETLINMLAAQTESEFDSTLIKRANECRQLWTQAISYQRGGAEWKNELIDALEKAEAFFEKAEALRTEMIRRIILTYNCAKIYEINYSMQMGHPQQLFVRKTILNRFDDSLKAHGYEPYSRSYLLKSRKIEANQALTEWLIDTTDKDPMESILKGDKILPSNKNIWATIRPALTGR